MTDSPPWPAEDRAPLTLCRIPGGIANPPRLAFLHAPIDGRHASLSVFLLQPETSTRAAPGQSSTDRFLSGSGNAPLLLASLDWSIPRSQAAAEGDQSSPVDATTLGFEGTARRVNSSETTAFNWVRTNRNFDLIQVGGLLDVDAVDASTLSARWGNKVQDGIRSFGLVHTQIDGQTVDVWALSQQSRKNFPVHAQRHVAALFSAVDNSLGRPIEQLVFAHLLAGSAPRLPHGEREQACSKVRLVEFELPAQILGFVTAGAVPPAFRYAYFDLMAIGRAPMSPRLSFHCRVVGSSAARLALKSVNLGLRVDDAKDGQWASLNIKRSGEGEVVALQFDLSIREGWQGADALACRWLTANGLVEPVRAQSDSVPFAPRDPKGVQGVGMQILAAGDQELWFEVGMLATGRDSPSGFAASVDFDWFFGEDVVPDGLAEGALDDAKLKLMNEAQARVIAVSPPIDIVGNQPG